MYPPPSSPPPMYPLPALPGGFNNNNDVSTGPLNGFSDNRRRGENRRSGVKGIFPPERSPVSGGSEVDVREYSWLRLE